MIKKNNLCMKIKCNMNLLQCHHLKTTSFKILVQKTPQKQTNKKTFKESRNVKTLHMAYV